jgi:hypothetical protein
MIRLILSVLIFINISYANSERYFIKLGSFKNLRGLEHSIQKLPYSLRSHVVIIRSHAWYIPFAYYVRNRRSLYKYLPKFKYYFPDAHINHSSYMLDYPVVKNYSRVTQKGTLHPIQRESNRLFYQNVAISEEDNTLHQPVKISTPLSTASRKKIENPNAFHKKLLSGKHYFLAYKSTKDSPNLLIKVSFKNHMVVYQPIIGEMKMVEANYIIDNQRLYMFANSFTRNGAYSILDKHEKNYFLVSSWINGKKLNTLRYYFTLNDAKEYLNLEKSNGLANILEDGNYDDFFLNNDY